MHSNKSLVQLSFITEFCFDSILILQLFSESADHRVTRTEGTRGAIANPNISGNRKNSTI